MADRYWVGGTASWDATAGTKWAATSGGTGGETVPTQSDNVFFDAASGTVTVTITATANCDNLDFTGFTGTLAGSSALNVYGSLTLSTGMTRSYTGTLTMRATTSGKTITTNGKTISTITFNGAGGEWTLQSNFSVNTGLTITAGTFNAGTYNVTAGSVNISGSSTRALTMGSGTWTLSSISTVWNAATTTNLTFNKDTANIVLTSIQTSGRTFAGGGLTYNKLTIGGATGISTLTITGSNTFSEIDSTKTVAHTIAFTSGTTTTVTAWSVNGSAGNIVSLRASTAGSRATLAKAGGGTVTVNYADIKDLIASPASTWYATNSVDSGNNVDWAFVVATAAFLMFFI